MKTSNLHPDQAKLTNETTPIQLIAGKVLKSILVLFIVSWVSLLSSCVVAVPNQRYQKHTVVVEQNYRGEHHDNGRHRGWYKHHDRDDHHEHGDRDDD